MAGPSKKSVVVGLTTEEVTALIEGYGYTTAADVEAYNYVEPADIAGFVNQATVDNTVSSELALRGLVVGSSALTIGGSGDLLTATADFSTANAWTGSPAGDITITLDGLVDGSFGGVLILTLANTKVVEFFHATLTIVETTNSLALVGDGTTVFYVALTRVGNTVLVTAFTEAA